MNALIILFELNEKNSYIPACRTALKLFTSSLRQSRVIISTTLPMRTVRAVPGLRMHFSTWQSAGGVQQSGRNWKNFAWKAFVGAMSVTGW